MHLNVKAEFCTGCRMCEMECSFAHEGKFGTYLSRVRVVKLEPEGIDYPIVCQMCDKAPCIEACSVDALSKSEAGAILVDPAKCIMCGSCVEACPFGAMNRHPERGLPIPCDLCGGDPACVKGCPTGALEIKENRKPKKEREIELMQVAQAKRESFAHKATASLVKAWRREAK